ncbi:14963_t:CDS:2, partial [Rhizophagus irregularis]
KYVLYSHILWFSRVFLGALSGLGPPFDDEIDISIVKLIIMMELKNENVDFIENTAIDIENVNPELIIKEEKEVDQDLELPPEDKEDIIDDIEDEGLDPIPLNNDD